MASCHSEVRELKRDGNPTVEGYFQSELGDACFPTELSLHDGIEHSLVSCGSYRPNNFGNRRLWYFSIQFVNPLTSTTGKKRYSLLTVLCTLLFTIPTLYAFAVAICTFSLAAPYLALAPVYIPQFERQFVIPTVEILWTSLWLTVLAAQADAFSSPLEYTPSLGSSQCIITLAAIEWYVLEASIMIDVHSLSTCRTVPLGYQLLTSSHM